MSKEEECQTLVNRFLEQNGKYYSERQQKFIKANITGGINGYLLPDIFRQIYDEVGIIPDCENIYLGFLDIIEQNFDINRDIVEVGGGMVPSLAKHIALRQKKGSVTVYDPRLMTTQTTIPNLILKKEEFTQYTPLNGKEMLVGFMPCEATQTLIRSAGKNSLDFIIALCAGNEHMVGGYYNYDYDNWLDWQSQMLYEAHTSIENNNLGVLEETYLKDYHDPYPVIYNKRLK